MDTEYKDTNDKTTRKNQNKHIKPRFLNFSTPPKIKHHSNEYELLSQEIIKEHYSTTQTYVEYDKKTKLWCELRVAFVRINSKCVPYYFEYFFYAVGSSITGFGSNTSKLDVCAYISKNDIQPMEALSHLRNIRKELKNYDYIEKLKLITAKVPILKFRDKVSGVNVNLSVTSSVCVRNTNLLYYYSTVDKRVRPLVGIIKLWARIQEINDEKCMTISSYSLTLMVIHYLQCGVSPPVLPSLQTLYPDMFNPRFYEIGRLSTDYILSPYHSENGMCLGELLIGFMDYFTNHFDFAADAMSIRRGAKVPKFYVQNQKSKKNYPDQWKLLNIQEPFDLTNTARSVYDDDIFSRVKSVFYWSWIRLHETKQLSSILHYWNTWKFLQNVKA